MKLMRLVAVFLASSFLVTNVQAQVTASQPGFKKQAAIASAHPAATTAGLDILEAGGNAFDAAVAVTAALAVVEPYSSGIGGGGFWLLHRASDAYQVMLDGRERAPLDADRDMYLGMGGEVTSESLEGPKSAGIPGVIAALEHLAREYGSLPLAESLAPAIRLAEEGFKVTSHYRKMAEWRLSLLRRYPSTARIFLLDGEVPPLGHVIRQPDLARTLKAVARTGAEAFYAGRTADLLVNGVRAAGGIWRHDDLTSYQVRERPPVVGEHRGARIVSASPPSSGGIALLTMLNLLGRFDPGRYDMAGRVHLILESMRRAYHDRALHLGDPDFWPVPMETLLGDNHVAELAAGIKARKATPSESLSPPTNSKPGGSDTSHFSVIDAEGNRVAATLSINYPFGSGFVVPGTGVLLNDEMDDFSAKPGAPNAYGLVGAEANAITGGKRPLSSMTPTFVETPERVAVLGTPGGSRIISMVLLATLDFLGGGDAQRMVARPRFHHQYLPDQVFHENDALSESLRQALTQRGHALKEADAYGNMQVVVRDRSTGDLSAASDPRGEGLAEVR